MIDLDSVEPATPPRSRKRLYLAAATVVLLAAGVATAVVLATRDGDEPTAAGPAQRLPEGQIPTLGPGPYEVRFEVESASGTVQQIRHIVDRAVSKPAGGQPIPVPWSTTVLADKIELTAEVAAISADTDEVTCRVIVNDVVFSELTRARSAICMWSPQLGGILGQLESAAPGTL